MSVCLLFLVAVKKKRRVEHKNWCKRVWTEQNSSLQLIVVCIIGVAPPSPSARWRLIRDTSWPLVGDPTRNPTMPSTILCIYVILCNNPGTNKCMDAMPVSGYLMKTEHPTLKPHETTTESMTRHKRALNLHQTEMHSSSNSDHSYCSAVMKLVLKSLQVAHQSDVSPQATFSPSPTLRDRNWFETLKLWSCETNQLANDGCFQHILLSRSHLLVWEGRTLKQRF